MQWFARYECHGSITDDQLDALGRPVFTVTTVDEPGGGRWCTITLSIDATDLADAVCKAQRGYARAIAALPAGTLEEPYRVTVEDADAPTGADLLSTAAVAARLRVSDARVRQLAQRPDFPRPLNIPGLAGAVYSAAAIDAWAATWDRDAKGGRPRKAEP